MKFRSGLNIRKILSKNTYQFCESTTLHGMKYLVDKELRDCERCFFGFSIITVICLVSYLIVSVYIKWETSPVIVSINPKLIPIAMEPFPAVTICNLNLAMNTKVAQFPKNSSEETMLKLLCKHKVRKHLRETIKTWDKLEDFVKHISPSCEDMLVECRFGGLKTSCSRLFNPLITDGGLCCVFNMLPPKFLYKSQDRATAAKYNFTSYDYNEYVNWSAEYGYDGITDQHSEVYPYRVPGIGESIGLTLTLDVHKANYYCSSANSVGFKFTLHSPNEWPSVKELGVYLEPGKETKINIKPDKVETSIKLKSIDPYYRGCLFMNEQQLTFFSHYTQRNCEMEYLAKLLVDIRNCSSYYMPKVYDNITVCSPYYKDVQLITNFMNTYNLHDCLPSCNNLNFHTESFSTKLIRGDSYVTDKLLRNLNDSYIQDNIAIVHMFFKDNSFRTYKQMEFIGLSDFLSSIGGLLSLFLGFSFISISELVYFIVLRPMRSFMEFYKNFKSIQQHLDIDVRYQPATFGTSNKICKLLQNRQNRFLKRTRIFKRKISANIPHRNIALITNELY